MNLAQCSHWSAGLNDLRIGESSVSEETKWQPIETAPKDSRQVFLAAYIIPSDAAARNGSKSHWTYGIGAYLWDDQWSGILGSKPSHWMPITEPSQ